MFGSHPAGQQIKCALIKIEVRAESRAAVPTSEDDRCHRRSAARQQQQRNKERGGSMPGATVLGRPRRRDGFIIIFLLAQRERRGRIRGK